ncbi:MAG: DUF2061 domain-containing protein [Hyphomonas sp.]|uniref:DUF2061 domain-containing protein n=1 Tax=Hyphomonas sp. TaxID=87 RepID=UPI0035277063
MSLQAFKTMTYSLMHLSVAMTVAFLLTGSWPAALAIGLIEPLVQTVAYTLHERAWARAGGLGAVRHAH